MIQIGEVTDMILSYIAQQLGPYLGNWEGVVTQIEQCWNYLLGTKIWLFETLPREWVVPILAIVLVFWPLLVSMLYAFMNASSWIIWLVTSVLFGVVQLAYVTYQFVMITGDLCGLSVLKSYSVARHHVFNILDHLISLLSSKGNLRVKSSRRQWRERLENAGTYEEFLKIRIEPKETNCSSSSSSSQPSDSALPPIGKQRPSVAAGDAIARRSLTFASNSKPMVRASSFDVNSSISSPTSQTSPPSSPLDKAVRMTRAQSFGTIRQVTESGGATRSNKGGGGIQQSSDDQIDPVVTQELGERAAYLLVTTTERLMDARLQAEHNHTEEAWDRLKHLLSAVVKRNHLNLDDILVENARSVHDTGTYGLTSKSRQVIRAYYEQVQKGLDMLADGPAAVVPSKPSSQQDQPPPANDTALTSPTSSPRSSTSSLAGSGEGHDDELSDRLRVIRKMKQNMGRTALMLSGGGAQAMYHMGTIRALIQSKLYQDIKVISGTSGGSIAVAMCALKTPDELFETVCVPWVSTDYLLTGEQKRKNIRWFPSVMEMASYWMKNKLLMDNSEFRRTCEFYYGDATFEEAFARTGKHVCITVSASRVSGNNAQRLLLNHISTPRVTLASAVAASCALPGVMAPAKLLTKNSLGELEPFEVDGVEWIDGSVQADLPFQRISTLFAVSNFIVSQTNFHIVPFLNKAHHPNQTSLYWKLFETMEWDIRSRALKLSRLGLFPRIFGQDISKVFKQKYHGNLTIVPRFTTMQTFGLQALSNPTVQDMEGYIKYGEIATWPYLNTIRDMIRLEKVIQECATRLEHRLGTLNPEWGYDDIESITSSAQNHLYMPFPSASSATRGVKISCGNSLMSSASGTEKIRRVNKKLQDENKALKEKLLQLQQLLYGSGLEEKKTS